MTLFTLHHNGNQKASDFIDLAAIALGTVIAYFVLLATGKMRIMV